LERLLGLLLEELGLEVCQRPGLLTAEPPHTGGPNRGGGQATPRQVLLERLLLGLKLCLKIRTAGGPHLLHCLLLEARLGRSLHRSRGLCHRLGLHLHRLWRGRTGLPGRLHLGEGLLTRGRSRLHLRGRLGRLDRSLILLTTLRGRKATWLWRTRGSRPEGRHSRPHRVATATHPTHLRSTETLLIGWVIRVRAERLAALFLHLPTLFVGQYHLCH